jgi:hypothetical protein
MDRATEILLDALKRAAAQLAESSEQRLYKSGKLDGLFPSRGGTAGDAAGEALRQGLLEIVRTETKGKTSIEWARLTPRGVEFLHEHESPVRALQELRATLAANQQAVPVWLADMRAALQALDERLSADAAKWVQRLDGLTRRVDETLRRLEAAGPLLPSEVAQEHPWAIDALNYLDRRQRGGTPGTCPLPELFDAVVHQHVALSIGAFHEGLRRLQERRALRLHPAASLAELPQPEFALLDGAALLYYAER